MGINFVLYLLAAIIGCCGGMWSCANYGVRRRRYMGALFVFSLTLIFLTLWSCGFGWDWTWIFCAAPSGAQDLVVAPKTLLGLFCWSAMPFCIARSIPKGGRFSWMIVAVALGQAGAYLVGLYNP